MKLLRINAENPEKELVSFVAARIAEGRIIIYPTDTVYGIGCNLIPESIKRVFEIKRRDMDKPLSIAVKDLDQAKEYAYVSVVEERYIRQSLDAPMTYLLKRKEKVPGIVTGGRDHVGIRIINTPFMKDLLSIVQEPMITTSANVSGKNAPASIPEISEELLNEADYAVDTGPCKLGTPSKVVYPASGKVIRD